MPDTASIVLVKRFTYRDQAEEFSNRYHFSGPTPQTDAEWKTLALGFASTEAAYHLSTVSFVHAYGYKPGTDHSVAQINLEVPGPAPVGLYTVHSNEQKVAGDTVATIRWDTGQLNSRGKRIYCRKYIHGVTANDTDPDELGSFLKAAMESYIPRFTNGWLEGGRKYCGPQGAVLSEGGVDKYLTTRTLKRRGKRPLP